MTRAIVVFAIALFVIAPVTPRAAERVAPVIAFELQGNNVMVRGRLQHRELTFLLDTGAAQSCLDLSTALEMSASVGARFRAGGAGAGTIDGARLVAPVTIDLPAGHATVPQVIGQALDLAGISAAKGQDVHGILGADFIRRFALEIDYATSRLVLHDSRSYRYQGDGVTLPLTFRSGFPIARVNLRVSDTETIPADAILDVGAGLAVAITRGFAEKHGLAEKLHAGDPAPFGRGVGGPGHARLTRLPALELGTLSVAGPITSLSMAHGGVLATGSIFDVNVGNEILKRFSVLLNYSDSSVTLTPNARLRDPFEIDMSGLRLMTTGAPYDRVVVEFVIPGSAAEAAGIIAGDRLVSVDGRKPGAATTLSAIRQLFLKEGITRQVEIERAGETLMRALTTKRIV